MFGWDRYMNVLAAYVENFLWWYFIEIKELHLRL